MKRIKTTRSRGIRMPVSIYSALAQMRSRRLYCGRWFGTAGFAAFDPVRFAQTGTPRHFLLVAPGVVGRFPRNYWFAASLASEGKRLYGNNFVHSPLALWERVG